MIPSTAMTVGRFIAASYNNLNINSSSYIKDNGKNEKNETI